MEDDVSVAMPDLATDQRNLAKAELDIAEGERRVTTQIVLIEALHRDGHDATEAEKLLRTLQETLAAWYGHRDEILHEMVRRKALPSTNLKGRSS